jgi:2-methylaconitate cis-trans-isomerase PrpF
MSDGSQFKIPATYLRGGTSKGVFFRWCAAVGNPAE